MKVVILAGGYGTRMSEETHAIPKPMVEIGGKPMLWHIMKIYSQYGFNEFILLLGYKDYIVKDFFLNYFIRQADFTVDLSENKIDVHKKKCEPWKVTLLNTGLDTMTGGRILQTREYIGCETFMLTYGDTLMDIDIDALLTFHKAHGRLVTMTISQPDGRYGVVKSNEQGRIIQFEEKPKGDEGWVNAGFFVCKPEVFNYIEESKTTVFEHNPLRELTKAEELYAFKHNGFYKCMDTLKDKIFLNNLYANNNAEWITW
ncbi:MAG: glucose-1-phosphate cytidylyltransferase [Proteobacteria bacterium]|nr:glucose-1-phosphate cytidylyltransferase [Pseudomonadota bacterium]MBU1389460.1 glucose-1-phosphate cytidylyltransferase [Pseudomonadota bacterium]MBU1541280.1 glucose-1-phosphate cytidylyltransferase [Pseudomonadota bacterium]MBU2430161.1 glucose-1-phosphate cytidylyltransferase [Pseudomonadota bacterium]